MKQAVLIYFADLNKQSLTDELITKLQSVLQLGAGPFAISAATISTMYGCGVS